MYILYNIVLDIYIFLYRKRMRERKRVRKREGERESQTDREREEGAKRDAETDRERPWEREILSAILVRQWSKSRHPHLLGRPHYERREPCRRGILIMFSKR